MTTEEVTSLIEEVLGALPHRLSGNEANPYVAERLRGIVTTDRSSVIDALRSYLRFRVPPKQRTHEDAIPEARIWMALEVVERLSLFELNSEIESLADDTRNGKVFLPVDKPTIARYLQRLSV